MPEPLLILNDEKVDAAHWAIRRLPASSDVLHAMQARSDLTQRRTKSGWPELSRDERRLEARYERVIAEHDAAVMQAYRRAKTAP